MKGEYVECKDNGKKRNYNARITLTDSGRALAEKITREALGVQLKVDEGISERELEGFYTTLEKLYANFAALAVTDKQ